MPTFHFGYNEGTDELVLWKSGRKTEVTRIPLDDAQSLIDTMQHVLRVQRGETPEDAADRLVHENPLKYVYSVKLFREWAFEHVPELADLRKAKDHIDAARRRAGLT